MKTKLFLTMLLVTLMSYSQQPTDHVARYDFIKGSLENRSTFGESGNLSGSIQTSQFRNDRFGRVDDAIRVQGNQLSGYTLTNTNNEVSVSFWFQGSAPTGSNQRIFQFFDSSGDGMSLRTAPSNTLIARFKNNGIDNQSSQSGLSIFDGSWHHIVFTIKNTGTGYDNSVYLDSVLHQTLSQNVDSSNNTNFLTSNAPFIISANGVSFFGNIDDFQIYKRAISSQEVSDIFNYTPPAAYTTAFVNDDATGNNDGSSWADAFVNLQSALKYSRNNVSEIWIADGTYKPGIERNTSFVINTDNLKVYGGFKGNETSINDRSIFINNTILSGDVNDDDNGEAFSGLGREENNFHVVKLQANNVTLDGLKISDGNAYRAAPQPYGGAILISDNVNSFTLKHSKISNNVGRNGGAIRASFNTDATVIIENCIFNNNLSRYGGALYLLANNARALDVKITNTIFYSNSTANDGAELGFTGSSAWIRANFTGSNVTTTITNSTFVNNTDIGTQSNSEKGTLALGRRTDNTSTHNGTISNSIFYDNKGAGNATTLSVNDGHTSLPNSIFVNNSIGEDSFSNLTNLTNINNQDPLIILPSKNFEKSYLQSGSPAIDAGDNSKIPSGIITDLLGNNRIFNTTVDIGAVEFDSAPLSTVNLSFIEKTTMYPNPIKGNLYIKSKENIRKIEVYNLLGKKLIEKENSNFINLSNLKPNIYLIRIYSQNSSISKRIIKN